MSRNIVRTTLLTCNAVKGLRLALTLVTLGTMCSGLCPGQLPCPEETAKQFARKLAGAPDTRPAADALDTPRRHCAGDGYTLLAAQLYDAGRLAEASRLLSTARALLETQPVDTR